MFGCAIDFLGVMEMTECCCKYFLLFLVKKMSFCLEFEKKDLLLHPSSRPGGGIGRRAGLKIQCPLKTCGFDSRPGYKKSKDNPLGLMIERVFLLMIVFM